MNARDLIEALSELDPETEVRLASWDHRADSTKQHALAGLVTDDDFRADLALGGYEVGDAIGQAPVAWLVEAGEPDSDDNPHAESLEALWRLI